MNQQGANEATETVTMAFELHVILFYIQTCSDAISVSTYLIVGRVAQSV